MPEGLQNPQESGLEFTDREGNPLRRLLADESRVDRPATFEELPTNLINATLAAEDSRYFSHNGIDYIGTLRAVRDAMIHREFVSGASTVTQQLAKVTSPPRPRELKTKVIEAFTARRIEMSMHKNEILAEYLNRIPYGNQLHGCRAAARGYFGKPLADLSIAESAFLAGLPNKPTRFNPYKNFRGARARQIWILNRLRTEEWITEDEFEAAIDEKLVIQPRGSHAFHAPHFLDLILERKTPQTATVSFEQRSIKTTLDLELQKFVESTVDEQLARLGDDEDGSSDAFQGAVVVIENKTGDVLALTGSRNFFNSKGGQINGAWTPRSAGSTLKPFTYLLALESGHTAASVIADLPVEYPTRTGIYSPVNFDRRHYGPVSMRHALANSLNIPAVRTLDEIGGASTLHHLLTEKLGLTGLSENADHYGLGLTIGNAEVRLLELTNAYATLARMGKHREVNFVSTIKQGTFDEPTGYVRNEKSYQQGTFGEQTLFDRETAWIIADILSDNSARADAFGFDSSLRLPFRVAAKTGTSTDFRDNWTLGFTPDFTVGVWVGRFDNEPLQNVSGVSGAGPIFHDIMERLHEKTEPSWYEEPDRLLEAEIDELNGKRVNESLALHPKKTRTEFFRPEFLPPRGRSDEYNAEGLTRLPNEYSNWLADEGCQLQSAATALKTKRIAKKTDPLKILSPMSGTVAYLDPDLPDGGRFFPLQAGNNAQGVKWESESLKIEQRNGSDWLILQPGDHKITAEDATGRRVATHFVVQEL
ncbi:UNVERIFIED_CONTAM: hypothetical protein GTU68_059743 [Idotea baltica]|nr:hypothetical protein [Idotea baltica]